MAEPDNTPLPSSPVAAAEETTPLLSPGATECIPQDRVNEARLAEIPNSPRNGETRPPYDQYIRSVKILSYISLVSSVVTGTFLLGTSVVILFNQYSYYPWYLRDSIPALVAFLFFALLLSLLVLRRISFSSRASSPPSPVVQAHMLHLFVNVLFDIILALYIANIAGTIFDGLFSSDRSCSGYGGGRTDDQDICERWRLAFQILLGGVVAGAAVVALSHLTLFIVRMIAIFRSRFWTQPSPWRLSTGHYTLGLEFTFKVLRQEGEGESSV